MPGDPTVVSPGRIAIGSATATAVASLASPIPALPAAATRGSRRAALRAVRETRDRSRVPRRSARRSRPPGSRRARPPRNGARRRGPDEEELEVRERDEPDRQRDQGKARRGQGPADGHGRLANSHRDPAPRAAEPGGDRGGGATMAARSARASLAAPPASIIRRSPKRSTGQIESVPANARAAFTLTPKSPATTTRARDQP